MRTKPVVFRVNNNLNIGGITSRFRAVLPILQQDFDVHVVTYRVQGLLAEELQDQGIRVHHVPLPGKWSPTGLCALARLFRRHETDIVHTHSFGGNVSGILAAAFARVPVRIGQVHTRRQHWYGKTKLHRKKQQVEEYCIHSLFSHKVLFPSQAALEYFVSNCPVSREKLQVLFNGIRIPERSQASTAAAVRQEFGIPPGCKILGFMGRLASDKGLGFAFEFLRVLREQGENACLLVVGGAGSEQAARAYREKAEAAGHGLIYFAGMHSEPYKFYRAFDLLFFPSATDTEALPGVVLEAAAHGLPILARNNATVREIAAFYPRVHIMDDAASPQETMQAVLSLPPADTGKIVENFSIEAMAKNTKALYESLLAEKRSKK